MHGCSLISQLQLVTYRFLHGPGIFYQRFGNKGWPSCEENLWVVKTPLENFYHNDELEGTFFSQYHNGVYFGIFTNICIIYSQPTAGEESFACGGASRDKMHPLFRRGCPGGLSRAELDLVKQSLSREDGRWRLTLVGRCKEMRPIRTLSTDQVFLEEVGEAWSERI